MKKKYLFSVYATLVWLFPIAALAQVVTDSTAHRPASEASAQLPMYLPTTYRYTVKAGDSVSFKATVVTARRGRFWKSLSKALIPAFILNRMSRSGPVAHHGNEGIDQAAMVGVNMAIIPAAIDWGSLKKQSVRIQLLAYDSTGQLQQEQILLLNKKTRKKIENFSGGLGINQSGYVTLVTQVPGNDNVEIINWNKWTKVGYPVVASVTRDNETFAGARQGADSSGKKPNPTNGLGSDSLRTTQAPICIDWYLCTCWSYCNPGEWDQCIYMYQQCYQNPADDEIHPTSGGGIGVVQPPDQKKCEECMGFAAGEKDAKLSHAKAHFWHLLIVCAGGGLGAFFGTQEALIALNLVPGPGMGAAQLASVLMGLGVFSFCAYDMVREYWDSVKSAQNNYYKDMSNCNQLHNCGFPTSGD